MTPLRSSSATSRSSPSSRRRSALLAVLHPAVRLVEHPNALSPRGAVRDRDAAISAFLAGKRLLSAQTIEVHEVLVSGDRVAVRATWRGTIGHDMQTLPAGAEVIAHLAGMLTVADGLILEHETFDCYEPLPSKEPAAAT